MATAAPRVVRRARAAVVKWSMPDPGANTARVQAFNDLMFNQCRPREAMEGDQFVLHGHQAWPGDQDDAGIDIFRLDDGAEVIEPWDVLQVVPATSANDNGTF